MTVNIEPLVGKKHDAELRMQAIFEAGGPDLKLKAEQRDEIKAIDKELNDLMDQITLAQRANENEKNLAEYEKPEYKFSHSQGQMESKDARDTRTLAQKVWDSPQFKSRHLNGGKFAVELPGMEFKALMTTVAGFGPANDRTDIVVPIVLRPVQVPDIFPQINTDLNTVWYMVESTHTALNAVVAEGVAAGGDNTYIYTPTSAVIEKISGFLNVTEEQLEDVDGMASILQQDLMYDTMHVAEDECVTGAAGVLALAGQTTALLGNQPDTFARAITLVRHTGRAEPNYGIIHPNDWFDIWTLQDADGNYIWGSPATSPTQPRIWGIPFVVTTAETENTAVIGDFARYARLFIRRGVTIEVTDSHGTQFTQGIKTMKATMRLMPAFLRPTAFCTVTGL